MQEILSHVSKGGERVLETVSKGSSQAGVNILYHVCLWIEMEMF